MQPQTVILSPTVGLDRDGISLAQTTAGAGNLTITGALAAGGVVTFDVPRRVSLYSAGNLSAITFTVTGTDRQGSTISEVIAGPNNATVLTAAKFLTVTKIAVSAAVGTAVEAGVTAAFESRWLPLDSYKNPVSLSISGSMTGAMTWGAEFTLMDLRRLREHEITLTNVHPTVAAKTASFGEMSVSQGPATAVRFVISSWTSGTLTGTVLQAG